MTAEGVGRRECSISAGRAARASPSAAETEAAEAARLHSRAKARETVRARTTSRTHAFASGQVHTKCKASPSARARAEAACAASRRAQKVAASPPLCKASLSASSVAATPSPGVSDGTASRRAQPLAATERAPSPKNINGLALGSGRRRDTAREAAGDASLSRPTEHRCHRSSATLAAAPASSALPLTSAVECSVISPTCTPAACCVATGGTARGCCQSAGRCFAPKRALKPAAARATSTEKTGLGWATASSGRYCCTSARTRFGSDTSRRSPLAAWFAPK